MVNVGFVGQNKISPSNGSKHFNLNFILTLIQHLH